LEGEFNNLSFSISLKLINDEGDSISDLSCVPFNGKTGLVFESGNGGSDFSLDCDSLDSDGFGHVDSEDGDLSINFDLDLSSLVIDGEYEPSIKISNGKVPLDINIESVLGNSDIEVSFKSLDEDLEISLPLESEYSDQIIVMDGNIMVLGVVESNDDFSFNDEFVIPEDLESVNFVVVVIDDGGFCGNEEVEVVEFDLFNGDLSFNDNSVLVFKKDGGLLFFSLGNDLDSISFNDSEAISSQEFDLSISISTDFDCDSDDLFVSLDSEGQSGLLNVEVDFFDDLSDLYISPGPEVGGFNINVSQHGDLNLFNLDSGIFFKSHNEYGDLHVDGIGFLLNEDIHLQFEVLDCDMGFSFNSGGFTMDENEPFSFEFSDLFDVSKSDDFDFLEIESINFLDSKPVFGFRGSFVFSKEISIVFGNDANFRFSVYLDLNLEVLEELSLGQPKEFDLRIGVLLDLDSDSCDLEVSFSLEDNCLLINPVFPPNGESINLSGVIELDFNFVSSNLFVKLNGQNVNLVVGINFEVGNGDVDLVVDLNFESGNLFSGPIFPVPNLVFMIVLPVYDDNIALLIEQWTLTLHEDTQIIILNLKTEMEREITVVRN
jgi:hypothetical protein